MTSTADEPARPARPTTVTVAFWLQLATVGLLLAVAGLAVASAAQFDGQITRAAEIVSDADPAEVSGERFGNVLLAVTTGLPALFLAVWFAATARPTRRGGLAARTLVYVGAGLHLLFCVVGGCVGALTVPFGIGADGDWTEDDNGDLVWQESEFAETLYGADDPTYQFLSLGSLGGILLAVALTVAVVLLLTLPPADRYFRPRAEQPAGPAQPPWHYPAPPVGLPWYAPPPGQPLLPGYPPPSGYPTPPPGYPPPSGYPPPGYLVCPDPGRHLPPPPGPQSAAPGPEPTGSDPESAAPGPESAAPGPESAAPGPESAAPGPESAAPGPESAAPGTTSTDVGPPVDPPSGSTTSGN
ncbi:hypothetical protein O7606_18415 [Micromonospora sp. WMMD882]|uniref:hypothetical protein n=1 Tax=Micromonospora sp. WMMD882 TaxID=3015151 RepID=UPI00248BA17F|nr:hypothetical protein [Micromonospora sp. WMMD882]WBB78202.1 hypothetical protein O7606_18415 [Micromonospora sp. WMMD882]